MNKKTVGVICMTLMVFLCSSFPVFAKVYPQNLRIGAFNGIDSDGTSQIYCYQLYGRLDVYDNETYPTSTTMSGGASEIVIAGFIRNNSYTPMFCSNVTITINDSDGNTIKPMNGFTYLYGDLMPMLSDSGNSFNLIPQDYIAFEQGFIVGPMKTVYFAFTVSAYYSVSNAGTTNINVSSITGNVGWSGHSDVWKGHYGYTVNYEPLQTTLMELLASDDGSTTVFDLVKEMHDAYISNTQQSQGVSEQSSDVTSTIDSQHQSEANYFQNSQTAIQDTGIQNFKFDSNELGGLNGLKDDFTAVWTSCGSLSRFWIASLTIGLALAIIRHRRMFDK